MQLILPTLLIGCKVYLTIHIETPLRAPLNSYLSLSWQRKPVQCTFGWRSGWICEKALHTLSSPFEMVFLCLCIFSCPLTLMRAGRVCSPQSSRLRWGLVCSSSCCKINARGIGVIGYKDAPKPSSFLILSLFVLSFQFGVKCISVYFICICHLFCKLWGPQGGDPTFSLLAVFLASEEMPATRGWSLQYLSGWLLDQGVLKKKYWYIFSYYNKIIKFMLENLKSTKYYKEKNFKTFP